MNMLLADGRFWPGNSPLITSSVQFCFSIYDLFRSSPFVMDTHHSSILSLNFPVEIQKCLRTPKKTAQDMRKHLKNLGTSWGEMLCSALLKANDCLAGGCTMATTSSARVQNGRGCVLISKDTRGLELDLRPVVPDFCHFWGTFYKGFLLFSNVFWLMFGNFWSCWPECGMFYYYHYILLLYIMF